MDYLIIFLSLASVMLISLFLVLFYETPYYLIKIFWIKKLVKENKLHLNNKYFSFVFKRLIIPFILGYVLFVLSLVFYILLYKTNIDMTLKFIALFYLLALLILFVLIQVPVFIVLDMKIKNKNYQTDFFDFKLDQESDQQIDITKEKIVFYISNNEYFRIKGLFINKKILNNNKKVNKDYAYYLLVVNASKTHILGKKISQGNWNNSARKYLANY